MEGGRGNRLTGRRRIAALIALGAIVVVVIVAAVAASGDSSSSSSSSSSSDPYVTAANRLCRATARDVARAARRHGATLRQGNPAPLAQSLFLIVGHLHRQLGELHMPGAATVQAAELEIAEFAPEEAIIDLYHAAPTQSNRIHADLAKLESIGAEMKDAASSLGLDDCVALSFSRAFHS
jgi:hypothetical protein